MGSGLGKSLLVLMIIGTKQRIYMAGLSCLEARGQNNPVPIISLLVSPLANTSTSASLPAVQPMTLCALCFHLQSLHQTFHYCKNSTQRLYGSSAQTIQPALSF